MFVFLSGFVVELGSTIDEAHAIMAYLTEQLWADKYTNSIRVKAVSYAANMNLLSILTVKFYINKPSGIEVKKELASVKMYRSTHSFHIFVLVLEVLYAGYSLYFALYVIKTIFRQKRTYFKNIWSFLDIFVVLNSFNVIAVYICHAVWADRAVKTLRSSGDVMVFDTVLMLEYYLTYTLALLVVCSMLKFLHMLRFNPIIYRFLTVLNRAKGGLLWSAFGIFMLHVQYGSSFHSAAAGTMEMFRSVEVSIITMYVSLMGEYDVVALQQIHPFFGPFFLVTFLMAGSFIGLNMMATVLIDTLTVVNQEPLANEEARLLELLVDKALQWLGIKRQGGGGGGGDDIRHDQPEETVIREHTMV